MPQSIQSFVGGIVNPITDARLEKGMSLSALAKRLGLSKQYLSRAEQGTYASLNPKLIRWCSEAHGIEKTSFVNQYANFQSVTRRNTVENLRPAKLIRRGEKEAGHEVFETWRNVYWHSVTDFCRGLCVHPETVKLYEEGIRPNMPSPLKIALREVELLASDWNDAPGAGASRGRLSA